MSQEQKGGANLSPAAEGGRKMALRVLKARDKANADRAKALTTLSQAKGGKPEGDKNRLADKSFAPIASVVEASRRRAAPVGQRGLLIAEGDSWFDYPRWDVLKLLEKEHGFEVESLSSWGDRVEDMAFADDRLEKFVALIDKLLRRTDLLPRAVLLSGGGNDVAGKSFELLINHFESPSAGVNKQIVEGIIDVRLREAYDRILSAIRSICVERLGNPLPVIIHGYGDPVPDGRGFWGGWWFLPGPWLRPGFEMKGFAKQTERNNEIKKIMGRFNRMLRNLAGQPHNAHVRFVDLRPCLESPQEDYKTMWDNELHPTKLGFSAVAREIARAIP